MTRTLTWSYGGGTQSAAIAVLIAQGRLPKPEVTVIADTGREQAYTWTYLAEYIQPLLDTVNIKIEILPHTMSHVDLYSKNGDLLVPAYTAPNGKLPTYCSTEWKKRVVMRYLRNCGYGPQRPVTTWIGFSTNEIMRVKQNTRLWQEYAWPLINDIPLTRDECKALVVAAGLPTPPRSSCWMCPFHGNAEWRHIKATAPDDWRKAVEFDEALRTKDPNVYVHKSCTPLQQVDLGVQEQADATEAECQIGFCFI